mgnify:CR=1 FL=1
MSRKSAEEIRAALDADPNTVSLAAALNMTVEDYAKLVVHFATTGAQPQLFVVPDAELKARGHTPPDLRQMNGFLAEAVAVKMTHEATSYSSSKAKPVALGAQPGAPAQALPADPALAAEIQKRRKS